MSKTYLWFRAWPFYEPNFPFERVELLFGKELTAALTALANDWLAQNPHAVDTLRRSERSRSLGRLPPSPNFPGSDSRVPPLRQESEVAPTFGEVAPLAGWVKKPSGPWVGPAADRVLGFYGPRSQWFFHECADCDSAAVILKVLRDRHSRSRTSGGMNVIRFGAVDSGGLDLAEALKLDLRLADYRRISGESTHKHSFQLEVIALEAEISRRRAHNETEGPLESGSALPSSSILANAEGAIRARLRHPAQIAAVLQALHALQLTNSAFLSSGEINACGISIGTLHAAASDWKQDVKNRGTRQLLFAKERVLGWVIHKWVPRLRGE